VDRTSLYIILKEDEEFEESFYCKIGISKDVEGRLRQLDVQEKSLHIFSEYEYETRDKAVKYERLTHEFLSHKNIKNEWFYLTVQEIKYLDDFVPYFSRGKVHYHEKHLIYFENKLSLRERFRADYTQDQRKEWQLALMESCRVDYADDKRIKKLERLKTTTHN
jgi:hypothetical protein